MDISTAARICRGAKLIFARPTRLRGTGQALDLGGKLDKEGRTLLVTPVSEGSYYYELWNPTTSELEADWHLVSQKLLFEEQTALLTGRQTLVASVKDPKTNLGLELVR